MTIKTTLLTLLVTLSSVAFAGHHAEPAAPTSSADNLATATLFMNKLLAEPEVVKDLVHDDFDFVFMGRTQISNVSYDKTTYFSVWLPEVVTPLVPAGFRRLEVMDSIADESGVALIVEGEADGINGLYDNKYVFVFKFKAGKILTLREYNSDLLVATRLYKQELVADE